MVHLFHTPNGRILGNGLASFRHGMLSQFSRKQQTHSGLDLCSSQGRFVVITGKIDGFVRKTLKDIVHKGVHNSHSTLADTHIRMNLLQHTVDVGGVRLQSSALAVRKVSLRFRSLRTFARCLSHSAKREKSVILNHSDHKSLHFNTRLKIILNPDRKIGKRRTGQTKVRGLLNNQSTDCMRNTFFHTYYYFALVKDYKPCLEKERVKEEEEMRRERR